MQNLPGLSAHDDGCHCPPVGGDESRCGSSRIVPSFPRPIRVVAPPSFALIPVDRSVPSV